VTKISNFLNKERTASERYRRKIKKKGNYQQHLKPYHIMQNRKFLPDKNRAEWCNG
jgi:hypothetical protein